MYTELHIILSWIGASHHYETMFIFKGIQVITQGTEIFLSVNAGRDNIVHTYEHMPMYTSVHMYICICVYHYRSTSTVIKY